MREREKTMAINTIIAATDDAVTAANAEFTTTSRGFWLHTTGFAYGEKATLYGPGPGGAYRPVTDDKGAITVGAFPNSIFVDLPAGTYQIPKPATSMEAAIGYEEEA